MISQGFLKKIWGKNKLEMPISNIYSYLCKLMFRIFDFRCRAGARRAAGLLDSAAAGMRLRPGREYCAPEYIVSISGAFMQNPEKFYAPKVKASLFWCVHAQLSPPPKHGFQKKNIKMSLQYTPNTNRGIFWCEKCLQLPWRQLCANASKLNYSENSM